MQHDSIVRCIDPGCGRTLARRVNFCPYCGTAQVEQARRAEGHVGPAAAGEAPAPAAGAAVPAAAAPVAAPAAAAAPAAPTSPAPAAPPPASEVPGPRAAAPVAAGETAATRPVPGSAGGARPLPPPPQLPPLPPLPPSPGARAGGGPAGAAPPRRQPVRLRWWLLALAALWGIWLLAKPSTRRIEAQMDKAVTLANACKPREAQTELIALRKTKATPEQLQQVQRALNDAAGMCTRKRQRDKAWREAKGAVEAAIGASSAERARQRLRAFTKRWGEDEETRAMKEEIDARWPEHRRADEF